MAGATLSPRSGAVCYREMDRPIVKARAGQPDVPVEIRNRRPRVDVFADRCYLKRVAEKIYAKDFELFGY
ncbi:hypothetical protein EDC22_11110 [Tepidamorphus gemmatus]|uniref:Uncharacterized protein n=1 Tax=Tepidamorphus gemmatus TaxID=747076 RepID=A0A4R3M4U5_9HYPH|nr:hypothetical protein [Tepidamorphus gemmatus]TCT06427.1 hypothetical protein EDC22_11110 [Tepidamorphus gemmatus]